jgi:hypothetical protein
MVNSILMAMGGGSFDSEGKGDRMSGREPFGIGAGNVK